jgi:hypothetical protein
MKKELVERFSNLFVGGQFGYGLWDSKKGARTIHEPPTFSNYDAHLSGTIGLGLVPVQHNGLCRFAAIDIDVDTIDHGTLFSAVKERRFPLSVCRSKSGGAHLYMFANSAGLKAAYLRELLKKWATLLGYPSAEIFPKQSIISSENVGSWINLPYFGASGTTTRYAVGPGGAMELEEFLDSITLYTENTKVNEEVRSDVAQMPPCLAALTQNGVREGQRNGALFNFAVFYRKSQPGDWQTATAKHNAQYFSPPLDSREMDGVIHSADRERYGYTCAQEPIHSLCDRQTCLKLEFGINHAGYHENGAFSEFSVCHLRKTLTEPPMYTIEVNSVDLNMDWAILSKYEKFKSYVGEQIDIILPPKKQRQWDLMLQDILTKVEKIEAPEDASLEGLVVNRFHEFLALRERTQNKEDILRGLPVTDGESVIFRVDDLHRYLQTYKLDRIGDTKLYAALRRDGCDYRKIRVSGRQITVWVFPLNKTNTQTEDFVAADFKKDFGEDM